MGAFDWISRWIEHARRGERPQPGVRPGLSDAPDPAVLRRLSDLKGVPPLDRSSLERVRRQAVEILRERSTRSARELLARPLPPSPRVRTERHDRILLERASLLLELEKLRNAGEIEERRYAEAMEEWSRIIGAAVQPTNGTSQRARAEDCLRRVLNILDSIARRPVAALRRAEFRFEHACRQGSSIRRSGRPESGASNGHRSLAIGSSGGLGSPSRPVGSPLLPIRGTAVIVVSGTAGSQVDGRGSKVPSGFPRGCLDRVALGSLLIGPLLAWLLMSPGKPSVVSRPVRKTEQSPPNTRDVLRIPENRDFVRWLDTPVPTFRTPRPVLVPLPHADWTDTSNTIDVIDGVRYSSDRPPDRYRISATIDRALAEAIDRAFGQPESYHQPQFWCFNEDERRYLRSLADDQRRLIESASGFRATDDQLAPDYDRLASRSLAACRPVALAVVRAFTRMDPMRVDARGRLEALTSYVQNAIPYRLVSDDERNRLHGEHRERFGLMTPLMTLMKGGDCDSKSLLLATMFRSIEPRLPVAIVRVKDRGPSRVLEPHAIMAVGVQARTDERTLRWQGTSFVLIESTGDWDIGQLSPDVVWDGYTVEIIQKRGSSDYSRSSYDP
jgi:hypothetical protein